MAKLSSKVAAHGAGKGGGPSIGHRLAGPLPGAPAPGGLTTEARGAFSKAIDPYRPGGSFGAGIEAGLGRARTRFMSSGMQNLVSAGLAGTTMGAGLAGKFAEEVAAPTIAGAESERARRLSSLYTALGGAEQAGFESAAGRSLSERLAQLQSGTSLAIAGMRRPTGRTTFATPTITSRPPVVGGGLTGGLRSVAQAPSLFETSTAPPSFDPTLQRRIHGDIRAGEEAAARSGATYA
jgi:hypothetical protein